MKGTVVVISGGKLMYKKWWSSFRTTAHGTVENQTLVVLGAIVFMIVVFHTRNLQIVMDAIKKQLL